MEIVGIPAEYASAMGDLVYTVSGEGNGETIETEIYGGKDGRVLGIKLHTDRGITEINASAYVRSLLNPIPVMPAVTCFCCDPGRTVESRIAVNGIESPVRIFTSALCDPAEGDALTMMTGRRTISPGERDEVSFVTPGGSCRAILEINASSYIILPSVEYIAEKGICTFSLVMESVEEYILSRGLDPFSCREISLSVFSGEERVFSCIYTVKQSPGKGMRLCWLNSMGGMDYFTFPVRVSSSVKATKKRILSPDGYETVSSVSEKETELNSGYLPENMLRALSDLVVSPRVWRVEGQAMVPVDVLSDNAVTGSDDIGCLVLKIRDSRVTGYQTF